MRREQVARIIMLRALGYSTPDIGKIIHPDPNDEYSRSCISKHLQQIKKRAEAETPERVFYELLFWLDEMDSDSLVSVGQRKYDYHDLIHRGQSPSDALEVVAPEFSTKRPFVSSS